MVHWRLDLQYLRAVNLGDLLIGPVLNGFPKLFSTPVQWISRIGLCWESI